MLEIVAFMLPQFLARSALQSFKNADWSVCVCLSVCELEILKRKKELRDLKIAKRFFDW